jgi:hypothetical protein
MPTLMTPRTFSELSKIWSALDAGPLAAGQDGRLAGIFVPWAGSRLIGEGGIYYVGMATDGDYWADDEQTFDQRLQCTESLCNNRHDRAGSPFWQFLDGLTWALLGAPFNETSDRWGWSNLLKIGWSVGNPNGWQVKLIEEQREVCAISLREEFEKLHESLIIIGSRNAFGVLDSPHIFPKLMPQWRDNWNKDHHEQTGVWSFTDPKSSNLYVHCEHPGYAIRAASSFWGSALGRIIHLARVLPGFASNSVASGRS